MRLSYVTVCVNYLDRLRIAHHHNLSAAAFDDYLIVTNQRDLETTGWTQAHKEVLPVYTDSFYEPRGVAFNKGAGLTDGLRALEGVLAEQGAKPEWVAIMDADTFVPPDWRAQLQGLTLDPECLYGARRVLLPTFAEYERLWTDDLETFASPEGYGFGWLQLVHWDSAAFRGLRESGEWYVASRDCTECDWRFREHWGGFDVPYTVPNRNLRELPFKVFNLGVDGVDHQGRVSAPFVPPS